MATIPGCAVRSAALLSPGNEAGGDYTLTIKPTGRDHPPQDGAAVFVNDTPAGIIVSAAINRSGFFVCHVLDLASE